MYPQSVTELHPEGSGETPGKYRTARKLPEAARNLFSLVRVAFLLGFGMDLESAKHNSASIA